MRQREATMARIGYARVSSVGQSLEVQLSKLTDCDKLYQEKRSTASRKRPRLDACLEYVREGDTLVVTRLDRLARSTLHLCQIAEELKRKQVHLQVLDQQIHTNDATGRLLFHMLGAIAQFETELRAERQVDGIMSAKARGVVFGRQASLTAQQIADLQDQRRQGAPIRTLMKDYRISKATVYRYLDRYLEGASPARPEEPPEFV
jgi:DNA invertase Pin-like site-specific DNA recombinase